MRVVDKEQALELLAAYRGAFSPGGCLPCQLLRSELTRADLVTETRHGVVLLNRFAQRRGHLMVWSRAHVEHLHELPWSSYAELQRLVYEANLALQQVLEPLRVYSATLGSASSLPMSYPHLHVHVIPVHESDERARPARVLSWSEGVVLYDADEASALVRELRASWPSHL